jgi:hypothetical protein
MASATMRSTGASIKVAAALPLQEVQYTRIWTNRALTELHRLRQGCMIFHTLRGYSALSIDIII